MTSRPRNDAPAAAWDALVPEGRGPLRHAFLAACEEIDLAGFEMRPLALLAPGGGRTAQAPAYAYDLDLGLFATGAAARALALVRRALKRFLRFRVFEVGCPVALGEPFCVAPGVDEATAAAELARRAIEEGDRLGASLVIVRDFEPGPESARLAAVRESGGFEAIPLPPTFVLDVRPFRSFDAYLAAMRSDYRRRARLRLERARDLRCERATSLTPSGSTRVVASPPASKLAADSAPGGLTPSGSTRVVASPPASKLAADSAPSGFSALAPELARLWRSVYDRAGEYKREVLTEGFFRSVERAPGASLLLLRRADGTIACFALMLEDGPWLRFLYSGFEPAARDEGAYFRLLLEIVRMGIEGGFEHVELGITTAEPKLDLGARPVPLEAWIRHRRPLVRRALAWAMRTLLVPPPPEARRVFKDRPRREAREAASTREETTQGEQTSPEGSW